MTLKLIILQFVLLYVAGLSFIGGTKGIVGSGIVMTILNYFIDSPQGFWYWQWIIIIYTLIGILLNGVLDKLTDHLRVLKVTLGSTGSLFTSGLFMPLIPAFVVWTVLIGIPLGFTYRDISKVLVVQIIFKFIFSSGWLIIGNILY